MAIQMNITTEGLAKFRAALETGNLETLKTAKFYGGWSDGAVSGSVVATLDIAVNKAIESNYNVCRFICQDKSDAQYTTYGGEVIDADGVVIATFNNGGQPVSTKQIKAEMMLGFEIKFEDNTAASSVINMGDTTFVFDDATETAAGIVELATEAEAKAGTDAKRAITPKTLDAVIKAHSAVVHRSGAETITGDKTFSGNLIISRDSPSVIVSQNDIAKGTPPSATQYMGISFTDKNGHTAKNRLGLVETQYLADGGVCLSISAYKPENGSTAAVTLKLVYPASGTPYIIVPTPPSGDNSMKIATTAWVKAVAEKLLPLAGGTMTNTIKTSVNLALAKTDTKGGVQICGGTSLTDGGAILGYGKDYESNVEFKGALRLQATDGTKTYDVVLFPDGRMRLGNNTQLNFQDNEDQRLFIDERGDMVIGDANGALLRVRGQASTDNSGGFQFRAKDKDGNTVYLIGKPDGTLTWDGKTVERVVASSFGTNSFYIKYASGLIIQGGTNNSTTSGQVTFPVSFSSASSYTLTLTRSTNTTGTNYAIYHEQKTATGFVGLSATFKYPFSWIAIGK